MASNDEKPGHRDKAATLQTSIYMRLLDRSLDRTHPLPEGKADRGMDPETSLSQHCPFFSWPVVNLDHGILTGEEVFGIADFHARRNLKDVEELELAASQARAENHTGGRNSQGMSHAKMIVGSMTASLGLDGARKDEILDPYGLRDTGETELKRHTRGGRLSDQRKGAVAGGL